MLMVSRKACLSCESLGSFKYPSGVPRRGDGATGKRRAATNGETSPRKKVWSWALLLAGDTTYPHLALAHPPDGAPLGLV